LLTFASATSEESLQQIAPFLFAAFAGLSVLSAWALVLSQNIVRMSVYLLLTLGCVAGLYFMMDAEFLAAIQLIVYAGGTLILIIFGVMLTSKNPFLHLKVATWERIVGPGIALVMGALLIFALIRTPIAAGGEPSHAPSIRDIGEALISSYMVPFEVAAVLLLVVMIGAAYMARRRA